MLIEDGYGLLFVAFPVASSIYSLQYQQYRYSHTTGIYNIRYLSRIRYRENNNNSPENNVMPLLYPRAIIRYQIVPLNGFIRNVIKLDMIMCQTKLNIQDLGI